MFAILWAVFSGGYGVWETRREDDRIKANGGGRRENGLVGSTLLATFAGLMLSAAVGMVLLLVISGSAFLLEALF